MTCASSLPDGTKHGNRQKFARAVPVDFTLEAHRFQGEILGGTDGTRTRDLLPDRRAF